MHPSGRRQRSLPPQSPPDRSSPTSSPPPKRPSSAQELSLLKFEESGWEQAEEVKPEEALPMDTNEHRPLVPYTPSPTPSPSRSSAPPPPPSSPPAKKRCLPKDPELRSTSLKFRQFDIPGWDPAKYVSVEPQGTRAAFVQLGGAGLFRRGYRLKLSGDHTINDAAEAEAKAQAVIAHGMELILRDVHAKDKGQVLIHHPSLHTGYLSTRHQEFSKFSVEELMDKLMEAKQSEDAAGGELRLEECTFYVHQVKPNKYGVKKYHRREARLQRNHIKWAIGKKSLLNPLGKKQLKKLKSECNEWCMLIALLLGKWKVDNPNLDLKLYHQRPRALYNDGLRLLAEAGVSKRGPHSLGDLAALQRALGDGYHVCCFDKSTKPSKCFGPPEGKQIHLLLEHGEKAGHVYLITNIRGYLAYFAPSSESFEWCQYCHELYTNNHRCKEASCKLCKNPTCDNDFSKKLWQYREVCRCGLHFWSSTCLKSHETMLECKEYEKCPLCWQRPKVNDKHECSYHCRECKLNKAAFDHTCFIRKPVEKEWSERVRWYGDIESYVDSDGLHHANLLILKSSKGGERIYRGLDCIQQFLEETSQLESCKEPSPYRDSYVVFHNLGGYDGYFLLQALIQDGIKPENLFIQSGSRILSFELDTRGIIFRDSLNFIPGTPLSAFPAIFELEESKGYFPHALNTPEELAKEHFEEEGERFPPQHYFKPEEMSSAAQAPFFKWWHEEHQRFEASPHLVYNVQQELEKYCHKDVDILRDGFEKFLEETRKKHPKVDALKSMTAPSFCNAAFRIEDMVEESIALLPSEGFCQSTSQEELSWLAWMKQELDLVELRHNRSFRPIQIRDFAVDGFGWDKHGNKHVFEYDGCFWHGCPCLNKNSDENLSRRLRTEHKHRALEEISKDPASPYGLFTFHSIRGCEFKIQKKRNKEMSKFIQNFLNSLAPKKEGGKSDPLILEVLGGRTTPIMHSVDAEEGEKIYALDFTSLYPAVNACNWEGEEYPVGHPTILLGNESQRRFGDLHKAIVDKDLFGVLYCQLFPPKQLKHPVIPVKLNNKLLFPLCMACAEDENSKSCNHSENERMLTVHLPSPEIRVALQLGYRLGKVFEAWHWPRDKRSATLLRGYITKHYMEKEYASGFPPGVNTQEEKEEHAAICSAHVFGEPAHVEKFVKNSGKRTLSKGMLNNFWGFFAKRNDHPNHAFVSSWEEFVEIDCDEKREIIEWSILPNTEVVLVTWVDKEPKTNTKTSKLIGAFTTSMARLRLHSVLNAFPEAVIYMDTDSVYMILSDSCQGPEALGTLGELKDEIAAKYGKKHPGAYIASITCTGPKSYVYVVVDREGNVIDTVVHMKGVRMSGQVEAAVSNEELRKLVDGQAQVITVPQLNFRKNIKKQTVETKHFDKNIRYHSTKRRFITGSKRRDTLPYGYVD